MTDAPVANNPAPAETPAAPEPELALLPDDTTEPVSDEQSPAGDQAPEDELEDVEFDGKKGKVSKALKDGYLRQADYTAKTQEVAKKRAEAEAQAKQVGEQAETFKRHAAEVVKLFSLNEQMADYEKATPADWQRWAGENPADTQKAWLHYQALKDQRASLAHQLSLQEQKWQLEAQSARTRHLEEGRKAIAAKVPGWNADLEAKLQQYATTEGFTADEWKGVSDPRAVSVLRKAYLYDQLVAKQRAASSQATAAAPVAAAAPVGSSRSPATDLRSLAAREDIGPYAKVRQKQMDARARRA